MTGSAVSEPAPLSSLSLAARVSLPPILAQLASSETADFRALLAEQLAMEHDFNPDAVLDYELSFYDTQSAAIVGLNQDFIASARLDNLLSCYAGLQALIDSDDEETCVLVCTDHEEVGSCSACGAARPRAISKCWARLSAPHRVARACSMKRGG